MYLSAVVLAAGKGERFSHNNISIVGSGIPTCVVKMIESGKSLDSKLLVKINRKPVIIYSLDILSRHPLVKEIVLVVNALNRGKIVEAVKKYRIPKISRIVKGGARRQDSVYNGLKVLDKKADLVLIHDAGRPFIDDKIVDSAVIAADKYGAAIVGVPVKATIKKGTRTLGYQHTKTLRHQDIKTPRHRGASPVIVEKTIDRSNLWEIQTPQVFKKDIILKAFRKFGRFNVTDDAMLVEKLGQPVNIVQGSYFNIKITMPEDLIIAQAISKKGRGKGRGREW
ncbi:MAG: IspD/TarI family cytidylyltransferase [Candidatus Omnitrophota bacterium]